jgi:hypothetical protein
MHGGSAGAPLAESVGVFWSLSLVNQRRCAGLTLCGGVWKAPQSAPKRPAGRGMGRGCGERVG